MKSPDYICQTPLPGMSETDVTLTPGGLDDEGRTEVGALKCDDFMFDIVPRKNSIKFI